MEGGTRPNKLRNKTKTKKKLTTYSVYSSAEQEIRYASRLPTSRKGKKKNILKIKKSFLSGHRKVSAKDINHSCVLGFSSTSPYFLTLCSLLPRSPLIELRRNPVVSEGFRHCWPHRCCSGSPGPEIERNTGLSTSISQSRCLKVRQEVFQNPSRRHVLRST